MLDFLPIHLSTTEQSPKLKDWLKSWMSGDELEFLSPDMWFIHGHNHALGEWEYNLDFESTSKIEFPKIRPGTFVWSPSPCTVDVAVEELRKARYKHQQSQHLFIVLCLMSSL